MLLLRRAKHLHRSIFANFGFVRSKINFKNPSWGDCDFVLEQKIFGKIAVLFGVPGGAKKVQKWSGKVFSGYPRGLCTSGEVLDGKI